MSTSFIQGLMLGGVLGVGVGLIVMWVKQRKGQHPTAAQTIPVTVITTEPGVDQEHALLKPGDSIRWIKGPGVDAFHVHFPCGQSPFGTGPANEHFNPAASASVISPGVAVNPGRGQAKTHKYSVTVNNSPEPFDPHVIVMGN